MLYDVDALAAEFQSIEIKFRGAQYRLGDSIDEVLGAVEVARTVPDGATPAEQLKILAPVLAALCPDLATVVGDGTSLTLGERMVLQEVVKEAMQRISKVPFRPVV